MKNASRSPITRNRAAFAALFLTLCAGAAYVSAGRGVVDAAEYTPAGDVPRPVLPTIQLEGVGRVVSFDILDSALYVLDGMNHRVILLQRSAGGTWMEAARFGERGSGPGEFESPSGIAALRDGSGVVVADGPKLHFFTAGGVPVRQAAVDGPCVMNRPDVVAGRAGLFVAGSCWSGDSLALVLAWLSDGERPVHVASDVRTTLSGRLGSFLVTGGMFPGSDGFYFGTGASSCVHVVREGPTVPQVDRACDPAMNPYTAPPSARTEAYLREQRARRPQAQHMFVWPATLPFYRAFLPTPAGDATFRQFSHDSLVMRRAGAATDAAVTSLNGFVGCRRQGCLWETSDTAATILHVLESSLAGRYLNGGEAP